MTEALRQLTPQNALAVARHWARDVAGVAHLRTSENSTWRVALGGKAYVLRLTDERHRTRQQLEAELDFVGYLSTGGLRVAHPLATPAGESVIDASDVVANHDRIHASVFEWLDGRHFAYHSADIDRPLFRAWGETMARLHELSTAFVARPDTRRPEWHDDPVAGCHVTGVVVDGDIERLRNDLVGWLRDMATEPGHYGLVHGDFERTNFLLDGDSIAVFDFDDCCRHWFAWDITCALWVFRNDTPTQRARILDWFLEGYTAVREPDARRMQHFSELVRLRTVALLLHRLRRGSYSSDAAQRDWIARNEVWLRSGWSW